MEEQAIETLKKILALRQIKVEKEEVLASPLDETKMYSMGGVLIIFCDKRTITEILLKSYSAFALENNYKSGSIVIANERPSPATTNFVRVYNSDKTNPLMQVFEIRKLQFDISTHRKVPRHRIITDSEVTIIMKKMNVTKPKDELPWIDSQDPMAKWIGARDGDIIEIMRQSESAGLTPYYRYCISNVLET